MPLIEAMDDPEPTARHAAAMALGELGHKEAIQPLRERLEDAESEAISDELYQRRRFDLCAECYRRFIKDPVGIDARAHFGFSQN